MTNYPKELHYIFYLPGTGGNFMIRLFSLSDDTQFLWKRGTCGCLPANSSLEEKLKWYSFKDSDANKWSADGHLVPYGLDLRANPMFDNPGTKLIASSHFLPSLPFRNSLNLATWTGASILEKYYYINVDEELYTFMNRYLGIDKHSDNHIGGISWQLKDNLLNSGITINPIHLKTMLDGDEGFLFEYKRVCDLMELDPIDDDIALKFFNNWRRIRVDNPRLRS